MAVRQPRKFSGLVIYLQLKNGEIILITSLKKDLNCYFRWEGGGYLSKNG